MVDMRSRLIVKYHATQIMWQCRYAGYLCYRGVAAFENGAQLLQYDKQMSYSHPISYKTADNAAIYEDWF